MKTILVPISDSDADWRALRVALIVARQFEGHVDAIFVQSDLPTEGNAALSEIDYRVRVEWTARLQQRREDRANRARSHFAEIAQVMGVSVRGEPSENGTPSASLQHVTGPVPEVVGGSGSVYDVIIIARPESRQPEDWRLGIEAALFAAGRPVLLTPPRDIDSIGETVVVGWNRTAQSARAMFAAIPLLKSASRVVIVSVETEAKMGPAPEAAARHLAWHGIPAVVEKVPPAHRPIAELLLSKVEELEADLFVMGAYSHTRIRETILGGVTRHMLRHAAVPVLMAH